MKLKYHVQRIKTQTIFNVILIYINLLFSTSRRSNIDIGREVSEDYTLARRKSVHFGLHRKTSEASSSFDVGHF